MPIAVFTLGFLAAMTPGIPRQETAVAGERFPYSTALAEGVSPERLAELGQLVQSFVDDEEIVGAEILVIKNGRRILHEAYGWRDREADSPMDVGSVFCVRSMTKPVIGAAVLMLVDEDLVELDDRVAKHLPAFDVEGSREITIEHLLTHTSGLPFSLIMGEDLEALGGIHAVARLGAGCELEFAPGSAFSYSDQGTDTLTALIEVVSGVPAPEFVRTRLLEPLGMLDSTCVMTEDHRLRERASCKYAGTRGEWTRFWSPADPPLFPYFLGSQGLYSTLPDYARFMEFWLRKGRAGNERLLGARLVRKALTPGFHTMSAGSGFPGLRGDYGCLMQLWTESGPKGENDEREVVAFGHSGSDGTHAWVFPREKAMVLYFTQSRSNTTGLRVEEALGALFLGAPFDPNQAAPPFEQYLGYYWEGEGDLYRAIVRDGDDLALEILKQGVVPLTYAGEDRWKFRSNPSVVLAFDRSEEGDVTGFHIGDHFEYRLEPSSDLPRVDDLVERVAGVHRIDLVDSLGPVRMNGEVTMEKLGLEGDTSTLLAWPDRLRVDSSIGGEFERVAFDGKQIRYATKTKSATAFEGARAELARRDSPFVRFGDWRKHYPRQEVIQQLERGGKQVVLVRMGDTSAPAPTVYVDTETGRVLREDGLVYVDTLGRIGRRLTFGDYRDVSGMLLPYRTEIELANPMIGTIVTTVTDVELGVEIPEGTFELRD